eukprot:g2530.t1
MRGALVRVAETVRSFAFISAFRTRAALVDAVVASSSIPAVTSPLRPPLLGDAYVVDGGLSRNWPSLPGAQQTVFVSPFPGPDFDVCPRFGARAPRVPVQPRPWGGGGARMRVALDPSVLPEIVLQIFRAPSMSAIDALIERGHEDAERFLSSPAAEELARTLETHSGRAGVGLADSS